MSVLFSPGVSSWIVSIALLDPSFTEVSSELVSPSGVFLELVPPSGVSPRLASFSFSPFFLRLELKAVCLSALHWWRVQPRGFQVFQEIVEPVHQIVE